MKRYENQNKTITRKNYIAGVLSMAFIIASNLVSGQQQTFYSFTYYKSLPGKSQDVRAMTEAVDARVQQERVNNRAITSWYFYEVLNPAGTSAEYDYVVITTTGSLINAVESAYKFDSALKKTFRGKDAKFFTDYYSRQSTAWSLVKEEIYAGLAVADSSFPGGNHLKYIVTDFMQPKPEKGGQYVRTEIDTFRLVHRERVKLDDISQWAFLQLLFPFDMKTSYSYLALNFYKDLNRMFAPAKYAEGLRTSFPNVSLNELFQSAAATRDNPRAELLRLVLYALPVKR